MRIARWSCLALILVGIVVLSIPLACLATLTGPLHTPGLIGQVVCPEGARLESWWQSTTRDSRGRSTLAAECVDANGQVVPRRPLDEGALLAGMKIYYPLMLAGLAGVGLALAVPGVLVYGLIRRRSGPRPAP